MAAARRGKSQARRTGGGQGTPGWVWLVAGAAIAAVVFLAAPDLFHKKGDFLRAGPRPDPDAQPAAVADADVDAASEPAKPPEPDKKPDGANTQFDFYTLLPGKEVQMSDAEIAATSKAEAARKQAQDAARAKALLEGRDPGPQPLPAPVTAPSPANTATVASATPARPLPAPVATPAAAAPAPRPEAGSIAPPAAPTAPAAQTASAAKATAVPDGHYLLQAGSFGGSSDAENIKARIAMLGLSARVESADIGGKTVYRVRMGPYASATELAAAKQKLENSGLPAIAIRAQ